MYKMNHPSEWAKFFDERAGRYRYKHKGSGVVRDTLMAIGKTLKKGVTKNLAKRWSKKGLIKYNEYCEKGGPKQRRAPAKHRPRKRRREMQ